MKILMLLLSACLMGGVALAEGEIQLGMTEKALLAQVDARKVSEIQGHQHGYSDFLEPNPVVYIAYPAPDKKLEYYFHQGKLYKVFKIYLDQSDSRQLYRDKQAEIEAMMGAPKRQYTSTYFSLPIRHTVWVTGDEELDLRFGAGFVYEVLTDMPAAREKRRQLQWEDAI